MVFVLNLMHMSPVFLFRFKHFLDRLEKLKLSEEDDNNDDSSDEDA